jgi:hypothetical protein
MKGFPVITKSLQEAYEKESLEVYGRYTPEICGYYGRACRQMEKSEGANRALCMSCDLAKYCKAQQTPQQYINIPVYSEEKNEDGNYDIIGERKEYV